MMQISYKCIYIILIISFWSCHSKSLRLEEIDSFVMDSNNGLSVTSQIGDVCTRVTYNPPELLASRTTTSMSPTLLDSLVSQFGNSMAFVVSISRENQEVLDPSVGARSYGQMLNVLSFRAGEFISLVTSKGDTLVPQNCYVDRTFGISEETRLLVTFKKVETAEWLKIRIKDFGLNTGNQSLVFYREDIQAIPRVRI